MAPAEVGVRLGRDPRGQAPGVAVLAATGDPVAPAVPVVLAAPVAAEVAAEGKG